MDKLQVLQELAADKKTSARIFKALADPPTTSLQRLKVTIAFVLMSWCRASLEKNKPHWTVIGYAM
jgi:hypothetical protein